MKGKLAESWPVESWSELTIVVAVSGGPDSVALADCIANLGTPERLVFAHYNHGLRGAESNADEQFVEQLARDYQVRFRRGVAHSKDTDSHRGESLEGLARQARYRFLKSTAMDVGARHVVTAHTRDDQVETILQRLFRGSGLTGLQGIPRSRQLAPGLTLVRPLLSVPRSMIERHLNTHSLEYRTDTSNFSSQFNRNRVRHELIPLIEDVFQKEVSSNLLSLASTASAVASELQPTIDRFCEDQCLVQHAAAGETRLQVNVQYDRCYSNLAISEALIQMWDRLQWPRQQMNRACWQQIVGMVRGEFRDTINLPGNIRARTEGATVTLVELSSS